MCAGPIEDHKWFKQALSENFDISGQCVGDYDEKKTRVRTLKFLGRRISNVANGYDWEADPKHVKILLEELGLTDCKPVGFPMAKSSDSHDATERDSREPMDVKASTSFRRAVARLNYLALDRADIGVVTNHLVAHDGATKDR